MLSKFSLSVSHATRGLPASACSDFTNIPQGPQIMRKLEGLRAGEQEYRALSPEELAACEEACRPGGACVLNFGTDVLQPLYKKGLIYLSVPVSPEDHVSIPPLEVWCIPFLINCTCAALATYPISNMPPAAHGEAPLIFRASISLLC